jgi:acetyltransferase-like isoleucine patch superfamily enzyme
VFPSIIYALIGFYNRWRLNQYKSQGLQIADDVKLMDMPDFGSEPYLISIGRKCLISVNVSFINHDGGIWILKNYDDKYRDAIKFGRITVHDNCFIGHSAIILPGVTIGPNSVVAAGSIVTKDIPPNTIAGGNPARPIRTIEEYGERTIANTPVYDVPRYMADMRRVLTHMFPRPW